MYKSKSFVSKIGCKGAFDKRTFPTTGETISIFSLFARKEDVVSEWRVCAMKRARTNLTFFSITCVFFVFM